MLTTSGGLLRKIRILNSSEFNPLSLDFFFYNFLYFVTIFKDFLLQISDHYVGFPKFLFIYPFSTSQWKFKIQSYQL